MYNALLLCLASFCVASSEGQHRILGGTKAANGTALYQASLRNAFSSHFCGGTVIHQRFILTAAHCTKYKTPASIRVVVGANTLKPSGAAHSVKEIIQHEYFNDKLMVNDISLLRLNRNIAFGKLVQPIKLPSKNTEGGAYLVLTGWGQTSYPGSTPNKLQTIILTALSVEDCQEHYKNADPYPVYSTEICTLRQSGLGSCFGDSGGPLAQGDSVVGIVSWGIPCAVGYPDVYTRVYSFLDWIYKRIFESERKYARVWNNRH